MFLTMLKEKKHFLYLSYYLVIYYLYIYTEKITQPKYFMHSILDNYIPFVKVMVIPYLFWYVYIIAALIYFGLTSKEDFYKLSTFMFVGMTICFFIYIIFPNGQNLRPYISGNDVFSNLIRHIYTTDTPTNSAPSMHVLDSIAVHSAIISCEKLKNRKWIRFSSLITMLFIIASTVMIKQHSIIDVVYGIILSLVIFCVIYKGYIIEYINYKKPAYIRTRINKT